MQASSHSKDEKFSVTAQEKERKDGIYDPLHATLPIKWPWMWTFARNLSQTRVHKQGWKPGSTITGAGTEQNVE